MAAEKNCLEECREKARVRLSEAKRWILFEVDKEGRPGACGHDFTAGEALVEAMGFFFREEFRRAFAAGEPDEDDPAVQ